MTEALSQPSHQEKSPAYVDRTIAGHDLAVGALNKTIALQGARDAQTHMETQGYTVDFGLSQPENKTYTLSDRFRFLVHVVGGSSHASPIERGSEINSGHSVQYGEQARLLASLVADNRKGTFFGQGGFILDQPKGGSVYGMQARDYGGQNEDGTMASLETLLADAPADEYSQIDLSFDATKVIGVMIKIRNDGSELGRPSVNAQLRQFAEEHSLPITLIEMDKTVDVTQDTEEVHAMKDAYGEMLTIKMPLTEQRMMQVDVRRIGVMGGNYNTESKTVEHMTRIQRVDAYGEADQDLTSEEEAYALGVLQARALDDRSQLTAADLKAIQDGLVALHEQRHT